MKATQAVVTAEHMDATSKATPTRNIPKNSEAVIMTTLFGGEILLLLLNNFISKKLLVLG